MRRGDCTVEGKVEYAESDSKKSYVHDMSVFDIKKDNCIKAEIENLIVTNVHIVIGGWCAIEGSKHNNSSKTKLYLVGDDKAYYYKTEKVYREHMNELTGIAGRVNLCNFKTYIDASLLPEGDYKIILCKEGKMCDTGRVVEKLGEN